MKSNFFEILVGLLNSLFTEHADSDFVEFFYTCKHTFGGGLQAWARLVNENN
jgi:hypothetical protein